MRLIFIYGMPATGKLTVARELAAKTGFKLFHNHLVVDLLLSVFGFGSPAFVRLREEIWLSVMKEAANAGLPGLIFTFAPERTVRQQFVSEVENIIATANGGLDFVELLCPLEVLKRRMGDASRSEFGKLTSVELFEQLLADGVLESPKMPAAAVTIDTNARTPVEAAEEITKALRLTNC
ncbi:MAG: AAA family ATPase [Terracidiphilus sp.]